MFCLSQFRQNNTFPQITFSQFFSRKYSFLIKFCPFSPGKCQKTPENDSTIFSRISFSQMNILHCIFSTISFSQPTNSQTITSDFCHCGQPKLPKKIANVNRTFWKLVWEKWKNFTWFVVWSTLYTAWNSSRWWKLSWKQTKDKWWWLWGLTEKRVKDETFSNECWNPKVLEIEGGRAIFSPLPFCWSTTVIWYYPNIYKTLTSVPSRGREGAWQKNK